jgi:hypothetical protein
LFGGWDTQEFECHTSGSNKTLIGESNILVLSITSDEVNKPVLVHL